MKTESLRARVSRISRQRRGGGTPSAWNRLTPAEMEEFARSGDLPAGVDVEQLFPPSYESLFKSLFDSWNSATRDECARTGELPAGVEPDVIAALVARRGSDL